MLLWDVVILGFFSIYNIYLFINQAKPSTGKVKEENKSDNENEEDAKLKEEDLDKTKKEDTPAKVMLQ